MFFEPLLNKKCIFIGFINSENVKTFNYAKKLGNIKCKIFGIKNPIIYGKNVTRHIDWDLEEKFQKLNKKIDERFNKMEKDIEKKFTKILEEIKQKKSKKSIKINDIKSLGKKHHRIKTPSKKDKKNE